MESREDRERAFHDRRFAAAAPRPADSLYAVAGRSFECYERLVLDRGSGRRVLEWGCGGASYAPFLARQGARVTGIDISAVAVERSRAEAALAGMGDRTDFRVMNVERPDLGGERFDLVCGSGILHHLDVTRAAAVLPDLLAPGGCAVFLEPLGHNPLINLYRRLTPAQRSADEHPLRTADLDEAGRGFERMEVQCFALASLLALPLRGRARFRPALAALDRLDGRLFARVPAIRRWAWIAVLLLERPRAGAG